MLRFLTIAALIALSSQAAVAQEEEALAPRPTLGAHLGYASVDKADGALEFGAAAEVASFRSPRLRLVLGVDRLSTDTKRENLPGDFTDLSVNGELRFKAPRVRAVAPYLGLGLGLHFLSNDYEDADIADIYDGVVVGVQAMVGAMVDGSETGRWGFLGEGRVMRAQNIHRSSIRGGLFLRF